MYIRIYYTIYILYYIILYYIILYYIILYYIYIYIKVALIHARVVLMPFPSTKYYRNKSKNLT